MVFSHYFMERVWARLEIHREIHREIRREGRWEKVWPFSPAGFPAGRFRRDLHNGVHDKENNSTDGGQ